MQYGPVPPDLDPLRVRLAAIALALPLFALGCAFVWMVTP